MSYHLHVPFKLYELLLRKIINIVKNVKNCCHQMSDFSVILNYAGNECNACDTDDLVIHLQ